MPLHVSSTMCSSSGGCISPCPGTYRACVLWILSSYYVSISRCCVQRQGLPISGIVCPCVRVSVLLPFRHVSVGCKFIWLTRSVVGTMSRTTLCQADRTLSDTTPPQLSRVQNTV